MSYKRVNSTNEAQLRQAILTYFQAGVSVEGMQHIEPFKGMMEQNVFTWERIKLIRRGLVTSALLEQVRGSTRDVVLRTTDLGRQAMMPL